MEICHADQQQRPTLNSDCWLLIIDQLYGDFRCLSRLMQVSKELMVLTVPKLYGQLGDAENATRVFRWTEMTRFRLAALLLRSSGFVVPGNENIKRKEDEKVGKAEEEEIMEGGEKDDNEEAVVAAEAEEKEDKSKYDDKGRDDNEEEEVKEQSESESDNKRKGNNSVGVNLNFFSHTVENIEYKMPLSMDYFSFLKKLPKELFGEKIWQRSTSTHLANTSGLWNIYEDQYPDDVDSIPFSARTCCYKPYYHDHHNPVVTARHARVLTEIRIQFVSDMDLWFPFADQLSQLTEIHLDFHKSNSARELFLLKRGLILFVLRHTDVFPGLLATRGTRYEARKDIGPVMLSNCILGPKQLTLNAISSVEDLAKKRLYRNPMRNIEELTICSPTFGNGVPTAPTRQVMNLLQMSPKLKKFKIQFQPSYLGSFFEWRRDLFGWLKQERTSWSKAGNVTSIVREIDQDQQEQLQPHKQVFQPSIQLVEFQAAYLPSNQVMDAIDLFRSSLETLCIQCVQDAAIGTGWTWPLSRLTALTLTRVAFDYSKMEFCPVLQELVLEKVYYNSRRVGTEFEATHSWRILPSWQQTLRVLKIVEDHYEGTLEAFDLKSLRLCDQLEELELSHKIERNSRASKRILKDLNWQDWSFPKLKKLKLGTSSCSKFWHRALLTASPNLQEFSSRDDSLSVKDCWWTETRKQSFERLVFDQDETKMEELYASVRYQQIPESWNGLASKITCLEFGGDEWDRVYIQRLFSLLGDSELSVSSTTTVATTTTATADTTTSTGSHVGFRFPCLTYVLLNVELERVGDKELAHDYGQFLVMLMRRPGMKLVRTGPWKMNESIELEEVFMEYVSQRVISLGVHGGGIDVDEEGWQYVDENGIEHCLLFMVDIKLISVFFRLTNS